MLALAGVGWMMIAGRPIPLDLFVDLENLPRGLAAGLGAGALLLGLWALARRLLPAVRALEDGLAALIGRLDPSEAFALAVISGLAEEFVFRAVLLSDLGPWISLALFTVLHTGPGRIYLLWTAFAALAGALFTLLVLWSGDLLPAILAHVVVNAVNLRYLSARMPAESAPMPPE
ncbi:MAG: CPBP family intramembrane glutamic endopeptidase [Acidobacteriota bacterium]